ncbi:glycosyltransferase family 4 protein [Bacteroides fragilis]|uniref:glycosyltransferase family 4 protein n=1 Tax=Bacteroides fragilis TaxID=817 RepID=UPI001C701412|nr:glycosyltransferase family 4 protein [Bacteroides fragilis]MBW9276414.1 glycosyltransferase family 4 protein [Bacteroides fragilis]
MKQPIKIAYCIPGLYATGGMERVLTLKINYLADVLEYDIYIILTEEKELPPAYTLSDKVHLINFNLNFDRMHSTAPHLWQRLWKYRQLQTAYKKRLTETLMQIRPDITISVLRREINFLTSIKDGSKKIGEFHFSRQNYRSLEHLTFLPAFIRRKLSELWIKQLVQKLRELDQFVVLTHEDEKMWPELNNVICIHNPASFKTEHTADGTAHRAIAVGRYTYQKGFDLLLPAWQIVSQQHPDWELEIFGAGDRTDYQVQAKELAIEQTCHLNGISNDIATEMSKSSIFILSSRYEGMPMVIGEAMACRVPPISFACPCGPRDIITDGTDGLLAENGNIVALAEKIIYMIEHEDLRKQMGKQAQQNIRKFYIDNIMKQWDELFKKQRS